MTLNWFKVRFRSVCSNCMTPIEESDYAAYSKVEPGQILCVDCGKEEEAEYGDDGGTK